MIEVTEERDASGFGRMLREMRKERNYSQAYLQDKTGIPQSTICKFEIGDRIPNWNQVCKLCDALDVSANLFRLPECRKGISKGNKKRGK